MILILSATHFKAPKRLYSAAGDGYFESFEYGESWTRPMEGLRHDYLFGIAVDSGDPNVVIVSASNGPSTSYSSQNAETFVYRKDAECKEWKVVTDGLPESEGSTIMCFAANQRLQENSTLLTTMVYLNQMIQVNHGRDLILRGLKSIFNRHRGLLQLMGVST